MKFADVKSSFARALLNARGWIKDQLHPAGRKPSRALVDSLLADASEADARNFTSDLDEATICSWPYLLHRTSVACAERIIADGHIYGALGWACFSVTPNQLHQAERSGAILFFKWTGPASVQESAVPGHLVHNFSPEYVESRIAHGPGKGKLELIAIMIPDDFEKTKQTRINLLNGALSIRVGP